MRLSTRGILKIRLSRFRGPPPLLRSPTSTGTGTRSRWEDPTKGSVVETLGTTGVERRNRDQRSERPETRLPGISVLTTRRGRIRKCGDIMTENKELECRRQMKEKVEKDRKNDEREGFRLCLLSSGKSSRGGGVRDLFPEWGKVGSKGCVSYLHSLPVYGSLQSWHLRQLGTHTPRHRTRTKTTRVL